IEMVHEFDRWKADAQLLHYKPLGWDGIYSQFKDPDGAFLAIDIIAFSTVVNQRAIPVDQAPRDAQDFLDPRLKGKIILGYPQDDDAVLFRFDRIVAEYGWDYIDRLLAQDVQWMRGSAPVRLEVEKGNKAVTFTASGTLVPASDSPVRFLLPRR